MKKVYNVALVAMSVLLVCCKRADIIEPLGKSSVPDQVSVTKVVNYSGQAVIYYDLPNDRNFKYVRAEYSPRSGKEVSINASFYTDSIKVSGFETASEYEVKLYSVSFAENRSEPVRVKVNPGEPAYRFVANNLECVETFGGVMVSYENPESEDISLVVEKKNDEGVFVRHYAYYSSAKKGSFAARGMDPVAGEFRVLVSDHWGNSAYSEVFQLTPIFETILDKSLFKGLMLPGDSWSIATWGGDSEANSFESAWDGSYSRGVPLFQTKTLANPFSISIDLGAEYTLSRYVIYPCQGFKAGHPRNFKVYGATSIDEESDIPLLDSNGQVNPDYTLLAEFESFRPSGITVSALLQPVTKEDQEVITNGEEFTFPMGIPPVRYLRIYFTRTWGDIYAVEIPEIDLFGNPLKME